jgi:hypothetical protein
MSGRVSSGHDSFFRGRVTGEGHSASLSAFEAPSEEFIRAAET